ncbi:hypothetical protein JCM30471_17620 [Desulfuromonas carbonis]
MRTITATDLARNLRQVLDRLVSEPEEIIIERNQRQIGRLVPGPGEMTALEAMADIYATLPPDAGKGWLADSRRVDNEGSLAAEVRDPWGS